MTEKLVVIDINAEQLISLRQVPSYLPRRPNGKKIHISAVYRWVQRGCGGKHLEAIKLGGTTYTSKEALQRFGVAPHSVTPPVSESPRVRINRAARARQDVERLLYPERWWVTR